MLNDGNHLPFLWRLNAKLFMATWKFTKLHVVLAQESALQERCEAHSASEAELSAARDALHALTAERDGLQADLAAKCAALAAAEQLAADADTKLQQHCAEAAVQKEAIQKVLPLPGLPSAFHVAIRMVGGLLKNFPAAILWFSG